MFSSSIDAELHAVLETANAMCAAARTAPKACAVDELDTAVLTGAEKDRITAKMRGIAEGLGEKGAFFARDADNVDSAQAVVLVGAKYNTRGLGGMCKLCGFDDCQACSGAGAACVYTSMDLGIALGSAVSIAADRRVDNRMMFTIGKAAEALEILGDYKMIIGIPLSVSGKTPFFDRTKP